MKIRLFSFRFFPNEQDSEKNEKIERAMDDIREKFGSNSISFGRVLGNDIGVGDDKNKRFIRPAFRPDHKILLSNSLFISIAFLRS